MKQFNLRVTTNKNELNVQSIHFFLHNESYWAKEISFEQVKSSIDNSLCFGLLLDNIQIGFARLITDNVTFGYLCDVFILKEYRRSGYASTLMDFILSYDTVNMAVHRIIETVYP
jgi:ribosomal protein S18 acetylase RimI-like enzyme